MLADARLWLLGVIGGRLADSVHLRLPVMLELLFAHRRIGASDGDGRDVRREPTHSQPDRRGVVSAGFGLAGVVCMSTDHLRESR